MEYDYDPLTGWSWRCPECGDFGDGYDSKAHAVSDSLDHECEG